MSGHSHHGVCPTTFRGQSYFFQYVANGVDDYQFTLPFVPYWIIMMRVDGDTYHIYTYISSENQCYVSGTGALDMDVGTGISQISTFVYQLDKFIDTRTFDVYCFGPSYISVYGNTSKRSFPYHIHQTPHRTYYRVQITSQYYSGTGVAQWISQNNNPTLAIFYDATDNLYYWVFNPNYSQGPNFSAFKTGYNATAAAVYADCYIQNSMVNGYCKVDNELNQNGHSYYVVFLSLHSTKEMAMYQGGSFPGHKHRFAYDSYNQLIGCSVEWTGNGAVPGQLVDLPEGFIYDFGAYDKMFIVVYKDATNMIFSQLNFEQGVVNPSAGNNQSRAQMTDLFPTGTSFRAHSGCGLNDNGVDYIGYIFLTCSPSF